MKIKLNMQNNLKLKLNFSIKKYSESLLTNNSLCNSFHYKITISSYNYVLLQNLTSVIILVKKTSVIIYECIVK